MICHKSLCVLRKNRNWFEMFQLYYALGRTKTIVLDDYYNKIYGLKFNKRHMWYNHGMRQGLSKVWL